MFEFESTLERPQLKTETCVVYDQRDGRIVHVHQFIGDGTRMFGPEGREDRARMALDIARKHGEPEHLRTLHPPDFEFDPEASHRVDVKSGKLNPAKRSRLSLQGIR